MVQYLNTTKTSYLIDDVLYSYSTPVAKISGNNLIVDDVKYSRTTSKQITQFANKNCLRKIYQRNLFRVGANDILLHRRRHLFGR